MTPFQQAAKEKFDKGALEHKQVWADVDYKKEIMEECLDLYNYAGGLEGSDVRMQVRIFAQIIWEKLKDG